MATYNILWYTGGVGLGSNEESVYMLITYGPGAAAYKSGVGLIQAQALAGGNTWNITFWDSGAVPAGSFHALVVASGIGFWEQAFLDGINAWPDYTALNSHIGSFSFNPTRDNIVLTGDDTDWASFNQPGTPFVPDSAAGPFALLINAINWAASGSTMGLVLMQNEPGVDWASTFGFAPPQSIMPDFGLTGFSRHINAVGAPNVQIVNATHPVMAGLNNAELSGWPGAADTYTGLSANWTSLAIDQASKNPYIIASNPTLTPTHFEISLFGVKRYGKMKEPECKEAPEAKPVKRVL